MGLFSLDENPDYNDAIFESVKLQKEIKIGDLVEMSYRSIYTIGGIYPKDPPYDLESTQGVPLKSSDVERILNKYHIGDRVISINNHSFKGTVIKVKGYGVSTIGMIVYEVRIDDTRRTFNACEEDIIPMHEKKKVNNKYLKYIQKIVNSKDFSASEKIDLIKKELEDIGE